MSKRAQTHHVEQIVLFDTGTWPLEDRVACRDGSEAKRHEIEERRAGLLPSHPDTPNIVTIVLVSPIEPPIDDEEPD